MRNISSTVNRRLELDTAHDKKWVWSSEAAIRSLVASTDFSEYSHVLVLGMYSGRDQDKLRLETACSSKFRARDVEHSVIKIEPFFPTSAGMKLAKGIGNGYCNLLAYLIKNKLRADQKLTFIHIPKSMRPGDVVRILSTNSSICNF